MRLNETAVSCTLPFGPTCKQRRVSSSSVSGSWCMALLASSGDNLQLALGQTAAKSEKALRFSARPQLFRSCCPKWSISSMSGSYSRVERLQQLLSYPHLWPRALSADWKKEVTSASSRGCPGPPTETVWGARSFRSDSEQSRYSSTWKGAS